MLLLSARKQDQIERLEQSVEQHQAYQTTYEQATDWLEFANERLASCSDSSGEKETLDGNLDNVQVCNSD